jgi:hypothetical protein
MFDSFDGITEEKLVGHASPTILRSPSAPGTHKFQLFREMKKGVLLDDEGLSTGRIGKIDLEVKHFSETERGGRRDKTGGNGDLRVRSPSQRQAHDKQKQ